MESIAPGQTYHYISAMADMFSKTPSEKGKKALEHYNSCWSKVRFANYDNDVACKLAAFEFYKKV
jgi:hypothetical protein